jgi:hypothetical protein
MSTDITDDDINSLWREAYQTGDSRTAIIASDALGNGDASRAADPHARREAEQIIRSRRDKERGMAEWKVTGSQPETYETTLHGIKLTVTGSAGRWKWHAGFKSGDASLNSDAKRAAINSAIDQAGL